MTRRVSAVLAIMAVQIATLALVPGIAAAQTGSPPPTTAAPIVGGVVATTTPAPVVGGAVVTTTPAPVVRRAVVTTTPARVVRGQGLARTGSDVIPMIGVAVALLVIGVLLVISVRRRRTTDVRLA